MAVPRSLIAGNSASTSLAKEVLIKEYRYTGKECDDSTGLYYYGARYYVPWLGRWMSCDPIGLAGGLNMYVYVSDNPIKNVDAIGTQEIESGKWLDPYVRVAPSPPRTDPSKIDVERSPSLVEKILLSNQI